MGRRIELRRRNRIGKIFSDKKEKVELGLCGDDRGGQNPAQERGWSMDTSKVRVGVQGGSMYLGLETA